MKNETNLYLILLIAAVASIVIAALWKHLRKFYQAFVVPDGYVGLLHRHGKFVEQLEAGRHVRWGLNLTVDPFDLRRTFLGVAGQEVLTADHIGVKVTLSVSYQITDALKATRESQSWTTEIYNSTQLALRSVMSGVTAEALLGQRLSIASQLLALVQADAAKVGVVIHAVEVKDVMLPAELKRVFSDVLKAKHEGLASLERARGESAALRNLANAARLLEDSPALMNLRVLQSLVSAQSVGNTLVMGMPAGFVPLKGAKPASTPGAKQNDD